MIYSIKRSKIHLIEKKEVIEKFIFSNILILCNINFLNKKFIEDSLSSGVKNFLLFEDNGNSLEELIDDFVIDETLLKGDSCCNVTTTTYDDIDECLFMFMQTVNDFGTNIKNDENHLIFYDKNHFNLEDILFLIKKYDPTL